MIPHPEQPVFVSQDSNAPAIVAAFQYAREVNARANPTQAREPIDMILTGLGTVAAAAAGWYARHRTARLQTPPPAS